MFTGGKLTFRDLPMDLRKEVNKVCPSIGWRIRTLSKVFAHLEAGIAQANRVGDYTHRSQCESIGNKIREWIDADKERQKKFDNDCIKELSDNPDRFFTS